MKKNVVWDWNGTLLNDVDLCVEAINHLLKGEGIEPFKNKEAYQRIFQFPIIAYYEKAGFDFQKTPFEDLANRYMDYYQPKSLLCPLQEGSNEVLDALKEAGCKQYLLSASKLDFLHVQVDQYHIEHYFESLLGLDNIHAYSKKELAKEFIEKSPISKDEFIFIGDSVHDDEVAKYAGCSCILIANGHEHKEKLLRCGSRVVDSIHDVVDIILNDKI